MNRPLLITVLLLALVSTGASAKSIYKTVGPDGKVTYSDHPADDSSTPTDVIGSTATSAGDKTPAVDPATQSPGADSKPARPLGAKKAIAVKRDSSEAAAESTVARQMDPALEGAVIGVLGIEDIVKRTEDLCMRTLPTSFQKYSDAATDWQRRNAAIVTRAHQLLSKSFDSAYGPGTEQRLQAAIREKNAGMFEPINAAQQAARINWCDRSSDEMKSGAMDVYDKPKLSEPLLAYR